MMSGGDRNRQTKGGEGGEDGGCYCDRAARERLSDKEAEIWRKWENESCGYLG